MTLIKILAEAARSESRWRQDSVNGQDRRCTDARDTPEIRQASLRIPPWEPTAFQNGG